MGRNLGLVRFMEKVYISNANSQEQKSNDVQLEGQRSEAKMVGDSPFGYRAEAEEGGEIQIPATITIATCHQEKDL